MVNINWGAAMTAAQQGRLAVFFDRVLERKTHDEAERVAYRVDCFTNFVESMFRTFAEDHSHARGVNEGLRVIDSIPDLKAECASVEELCEKLGELHSVALLAFGSGVGVDSPAGNRTAKRLYELTYLFHMECLRDYLKGKTK